MKTFLNWAAIAILLALIVWGYTLNRAHQKRWTDTDVQKSLNDTIVAGDGTYIRVRRGDTSVGDGHIWDPGNGKLYRKQARDSAERRAGR